MGFAIGDRHKLVLFTVYYFPFVFVRFERAMIHLLHTASWLISDVLPVLRYSFLHTACDCMNNSGARVSHTILFYLIRNLDDDCIMVVQPRGRITMISNMTQ